MKKSDLRARLKLKSLGEIAGRDIKKYRFRVVAYPKNPADSGPSIDLVAPDDLVKEIAKAAKRCGAVTATTSSVVSADRHQGRP